MTTTLIPDSGLRTLAVLNMGSQKPKVTVEQVAGRKESCETPMTFLFL